MLFYDENIWNLPVDIFYSKILFLPFCKIRLKRFRVSLRFCPSAIMSPCFLLFLFQSVWLFSIACKVDMQSLSLCAWLTSLSWVVSNFIATMTFLSLRVANVALCLSPTLYWLTLLLMESWVGSVIWSLWRCAVALGICLASWISGLLVDTCT